MLQLSLRPGEYLTIHGDIVVQLAQLSGSRAFLRVEADRSIPIVRGKVLERLEAGDSREEAQALRTQLEHLLPTVWEEELSGQIQALFRSKTAQDV